MEKIKPFSIVKSLDFAGNKDCYIIGTFIGMKRGLLQIRGYLRVWDGKAEDTNETYLVPPEGVFFMDEKFPGRVTVL